METRRIVMTSTFYPPYHLGGDAVHVKYLAEALVDHGHEVHVLHSMDAYHLKTRGREPQPESSEVHVHPVSTSMGPASAAVTYITGSNRRIWRQLKKVVSEVRPDWVHHHNISLLGHEVLGVGRMPRLYTAHDHWLVCPRSDMMYRGRERCDGSGCTTCSIASGRPPQIWRNEEFMRSVEGIDRTIAPSHYMSEVLREHAGLRATVLPNFVPRPGCQARTPSHFLFAGVLEEHKGLDLLLRAYQASGVEAELHIAGSGSLEGMVDEFEERTGGKVRKLGFLQREDMLKEISSALCLVAPSACWENSPLSCIEALSMGVPLLVSPRGGLPELVSGPCGLVADLTVDGLASALRMFEDERDMRERMAANALRRYEELHTPEGYISRYLELAEGSA